MPAISSLIQSALGRHGLRLVRPSFPDTRPIDLFSVLVEKEIARRGTPHLCLLQIGANDGQTNDPVHEKIVGYGWRAVCVEPLPAPFERLCNTYAAHPRVSCANCAIGATDGEATIYTVRGAPDDPDQVDQLSSFSKEVILRQQRRYPGIEKRIVPVTVPTVTIRSLIREYALEQVDILQVDVEGYDYEILRLAFDDDLCPALIQFESKHLSLQDQHRCGELLSSRGYSTLTSHGDTVAYRTAA